MKRWRPKKSKLEYVRRHFKRRMLQRFGIEVTDHVINELVHQINSGTAKFMIRQSLTKTCFAVCFDGKEFAVIYNSKYKTFSTAMPLEWMGNKSVTCESLEDMEEEVIDNGERNRA